MAWSKSSSFGGDKLEFRQIVLAHLKKILEISSSELRDKTLVKHHGNYSETIESEDTRQSYIQSIENLAYVLIPYFDDKMKIIYEECIKIIDAFGYEVKRDLKEEYERIKKETGKNDLGEVFILEMKLKYAKKMFIALNQLLERNDYLKQGVYGDSSDEIAYVDDDEEDES